MKVVTNLKNIATASHCVHNVETSTLVEYAGDWAATSNKCLILSLSIIHFIINSYYVKLVTGCLKEAL